MATTDLWLSTTHTSVDDSMATRAMLLFVTACVIGVLGVASNGFILLVLLVHVKSRYRQSTLLVINQTITDMVCSAILLLSTTTAWSLTGKLEDKWGDFLAVPGGTWRSYIQYSTGTTSPDAWW